MNPAQLLAHFDRISDAPDAVLRFRQFILELAVRGKLVEQNPNDNPVSYALAIADKARIEIAKEDRRADAENQILLAGEYRWEVPSSWKWRGLAYLALFIDYRGNTPAKVESGVRLITAKNVKKGYINLSPEEFVTTEIYKSWMTRGFPQIGDVLFTTEAPMGNAAVVHFPEQFALAQRVICFRPYGAVSPDFLVLQILAGPFQSILDLTATGLTAKGIKAAKLKRLPSAVPPLAEQHRIVAKVDELMALCDRLDAAQAERESRRSQLVAASLNQLNHPVAFGAAPPESGGEPRSKSSPPQTRRGRAPSDGVVQNRRGRALRGGGAEQVLLNQPAGAGATETLREHAQFYLSHLPRLTSRPEHIKQLRQTILNLAVRGKLVPQDPNDESASELLNRIQEEKARLVKAGQVRQQERMLPISDEEKSFAVPRGWKWVRMQQAFDVRDGTHATPAYVDGDGVPLITSRNFIDGKISFDNAKSISWIDHYSIKKRSGVDRGDILYSMIGGNIGNQVLVDTDREFSIKNVALFKYYAKTESVPQYLNLFLKTVTIGLQNSAAGGAQPFVSLSLLRNIPLPLPPLAEQHRIVAKVDELMALCDRLEEQLTTAQTESRRLLESVLFEALNGQLPTG